MRERIPESEWKWFGNAGDLIIGNDCRFHLCTQIGEYLISTIGEYLPGEGFRDRMAEMRGNPLQGRGDARLMDWMKKFGYEEVGYNRKFETMVFLAGKPCSAPDCECGQPEIDGSELDFHGSNSAGEATKGHMELCNKWASVGPFPWPKS